MSKRYPFLGEFESNGVTYEVTRLHYRNPALEAVRDEEDLIEAVKSIAIQEQAKKQSGDIPGALWNHGNMKEDPVSRFVGDILIIDANNLAHRCRHVFNLSNDGIDVSVTYGFLKTLSATMRKFDTKAVIVCWDSSIPAYRRKYLPEYKQHRSHDEDLTWDDFNRQMSELQALLPKLGVASVKVRDCEADDLVYHATRMLHDDYRKVVVSADQDLLQCVRYDTIVFQPMKDNQITVENFKEFTGVDRKNFLIYRSLVGDSSDNIAGCKGIGNTYALRLMEEYGHDPAGMLNAAAGNNPNGRWMTDSIASKLLAYGLQGFSNTMAVIRLDIDRVGARLALYKQFQDWQPFNKTAVRMYFFKHAFVSLDDQSFYNQFKDLQGPLSVLMPEIGYKLRMPRIASRRSPLNSAGG